jgi:hypothetical protein
VFGVQITDAASSCLPLSTWTPFSLDVGGVHVPTFFLTPPGALTYHIRLVLDTYIDCTLKYRRDRPRNLGTRLPSIHAHTLLGSLWGKTPCDAQKIALDGDRSRTGTLHDNRRCHCTTSASTNPIIYHYHIIHQHVHIRHKLKIILYMMINRIHTRVFNLQFLDVVYIGNVHVATLTSRVWTGNGIGPLGLTLIGRPIWTTYN